MIIRPCTDCSTPVHLTTDEVLARTADGPEAAGAPPIWCDGCLSNHDVPTTPVARAAETVPVPSAAPHAILSERAAAPIVQLVPLPKLEQAEAEAHAAEVRQDVVNLLEAYVAAARAGELNAIAVAAVTADGCIKTRFTTRSSDTPLMVGAVAALQHRYTSWALAERSEDTSETEGT